MDIEIRSDSVIIDGYVNAVGRESRSILTSDGKCREIIEPDSFRKGLERAEDVSLLLNHNKGKVYASVSDGNLKLSEDNIGLRAHAVVTDSTLIEKARSGELRGWSFGMYVNNRTLEERSDGEKVRHITDLDIYEVSLIDSSKVPCYAATSIECRADGESISELRSHEEAAEITDNTEPEVKPDLPDYDEWDRKLSEMRAFGEVLEAEKRLEELRYNPYHNPSNGQFASAGTGGFG